jgi:hypothetical protein
MIQKTSKNYKYNLINVTNILHKLVETSNMKINFNFISTSSKNTNLTFFCIFFSRKREKNSWNVKALFWMY